MTDEERILTEVRRVIANMSEADQRAVESIATTFRAYLKADERAYTALALVGAEAACR
jgi:hypothetical protein